MDGVLANFFWNFLKVEIIQIPFTCILEKINKNHDRKKLFGYHHSVPEWIWIKGSYLSQWLPQGERGPPKESKSRWIEILHGGSRFTLWFCENRKISKIFGSLQKFFLLYNT